MRLLLKCVLPIILTGRRTLVSLASIADNVERTSSRFDVA